MYESDEFIVIGNGRSENVKYTSWDNVEVEGVKDGLDMD